MFAHTIPFAPEQVDAVLAEAPTRPAVIGLGFGEGRQPYIAQTTDARRRLRRMLASEGGSTRRLQLLPLVRSISWTTVGSPFASSLIFYRICAAVYGGADARRRLRLRAPVVLRLSAKNDFPRLYVSESLRRRASGSEAKAVFGPFPSRASAERCLESVLDLFQLRRCHENLQPYPEHPGCIYGEMKKCLAPCRQAATPERYRREAEAVGRFLRTRGESLLAELVEERDAASADLDFERAAEIHERWRKAAAMVKQMPECARPLSGYTAVMVQPSCEESSVSLFLMSDGRLRGPVAFSTLGMRLHNERSGSSSLFSHPAALAPVAYGAAATAGGDVLEQRLRAALETLHQTGGVPEGGESRSMQTMEDELALFLRWCARPPSRRQGEVIFSQGAGAGLPHQPLLRAISRVARQSAAALVPGQGEDAEGVRRGIPPHPLEPGLS